MKVSESLIRAKKLISPEEQWCKGAMRQYHSAVPVSRCSLAAMYDVVHRRQDVVPLLTAFREANDILNVPIWNDENGRKHSDVMQAFDKAIAYTQVREELKVADAKPICREVDSQLNTGCESAEEVV